MSRVDRPRIGISRCLLGDEVRYDGGHQREAFLVDTFGPYVEWVPVCPEVEMGMGTPREPIQLVAAAGGVPSGSRRVRLVGVKSGRDWTSSIVEWRDERLRELARAGLSGYVLKKDSPSCGMEHVRVQTRRGVTRTGRGLFAEALSTTMPSLPIEDESRLRDPHLRENFVERVFAYDRLKRFLTGRWTTGGLVAFHTAHKLQLLSHSRAAYDALGRLVARAKELGRREVASRYERAFMDGLRRPATPGRHADVMLHAAGHLRRVVDEGSRRELLAAIEDHRRGVLPLTAPMALIRSHVRRHRVEYLACQVYLDPYPRGLSNQEPGTRNPEPWLRNHA